LKGKSISFLSVLILTVVGSTLLSFPPVFANPACGATITKNTTLTANIGPCSGAGLTIGANGITLNCAGHTISGASGNNYIGISLSGVTQVTVEKCKVTGFFNGFYLLSSFSNKLTGNTASKNKDAGFSLSSSSGNTLTGNTAKSNYWGFFLYGSPTNTFTGNTANSNLWGFYLLSSSGNTLTGNTANKNKNDGFYLDPSSSSNIITTNTANTNTTYGYYDDSTSSSPGVPHWDTANSYTGDKGSGNGSDLAYGNANLDTATSPF